MQHNSGLSELDSETTKRRLDELTESLKSTGVGDGNGYPRIALNDCKGERYTVAFDIDDTCADLGSEMAEIASVTAGRVVHESEFTEYGKLEEQFGLSDSALLTALIERRSLERVLPYVGVRDTIIRLVEFGYRIEFVTARGWVPGAYDITRNWLELHDIPYDEITIVGLDESKASAVTGTQIIAFIDDRIDHCMGMLESGRTTNTYLMDQPWNQHVNADEIPGVTRIHSVSELLDLME